MTTTAIGSGLAQPLSIGHVRAEGECDATCPVGKCVHRLSEPVVVEMDRDRDDAGPVTVQIGSVGSMLGRSLWLLAEAVLIPAALLYMGLRIGGTVAGLCAVLAWRLGLPAARILTGRRVPTIVLLATAVFCIRTGVSVALSSVFFFLWQPVLISAAMGVWFIATALAGRPITMRLAQDVVTLPESLRTDPRVRRVFCEVAMVWGVVHVVCAGLGALTMRGEATTVVVVHGLLGVVCAVAANGGCAVWGWWRMRRLDGITLRFGQAPDPKTVSVPVGAVA